MSIARTAVAVTGRATGADYFWDQRIRWPVDRRISARAHIRAMIASPSFVNSHDGGYGAIE
jgi:hypothetical protein